MKLLNCYEQIGAKWTAIAKIFPNRTANNVKNKLKQLLRRMHKYIRETSIKRKPDALEQQPIVISSQNIMKIPETQEHLSIPVSVPYTSDQPPVSPGQ